MAESESSSMMQDQAVQEEVAPVPCDEQVAQADRLIELMGSVVRRTQPRRDKRDVYLIAYLARVRSLLASMRTLCVGGNHDGMWTLYRTLFETWLHGAYLATGEKKAFDALEAQKDYEWTRMDKAFGRNGAPSEGERLSVVTVAKRLGDILKTREPGSEAWPEDAYKNHYRVTSFHDTHGHLGSVALYIDDSGDVSLNRDPRPAHHIFAVAISLAIGLTNLVAEELGLDVSANLRSIQNWRFGSPR